LLSTQQASLLTGFFECLTCLKISGSAPQAITASVWASEPVQILPIVLRQGIRTERYE